MEDMGSPRPGVVDVQRGSHEVIPWSMEESPHSITLNASSTGQCPQVTHVKTSQKHDTIGGLNKHHAATQRRMVQEKIPRAWTGPLPWKLWSKTMERRWIHWRP